MIEKKDNFDINISKMAKEDVNTLFLQYIQKKEVKGILSLVQQGMDPNIKLPFGNSALHVLTDEGCVSGVKFLIEKGATAQVVNGFGDTPLTRACLTGSLELVKLLIDSSYIDSRRIFNETALHLAARANQGAILHLLLQKKPNLSAKNKRGETPLAVAVEEGNLLAAEKLVKAGSDVTLDVLGKQTLLMMAVKRFDVDMMNLLLENGANLNQSTKLTGETALMTAVRGKNLKIINALLLRGADVLKQNMKNETVFDLAQKNEEILSLLNQYRVLQQERILRAQKISSAFLKAVETNDIQEMYVLAMRGVVMKENQALKNNSLVQIAESGDVTSAQKLLEEGHQVDLPTLSGDTALMRAAQNGDEQMADLLIKFGADVNFQNKEGKTALMSAVQFEKIEMIKYLVLQGARLDLKNKDGQSALNMALQSSNKGIFDLLIDIDLIKKGLLNMELKAVKIGEQGVQKKDCFGRDYTF
ncbi:MAG: ankyrin repeat domain-containing protein [Alphaproteobacteria bacterium]|nr:ankyrin repeat domain-containing protein [Alphaproteobacteria bacterium]